MMIRSKTKFAILGALALQPSTGYDLKKFLSQSVGHFWKVSYGQVYPLLKQLEQAGLASVKTEKHESRPERYIHTITNTGKVELEDWLNSPLDMSNQDIHREGLLKIFFGHFAAQGTVVSHLNSLKEYSQRGRETYTQIESGLLENHANNPHLPFWLLTLAYGKSNAEALNKWSDNALSILKQMD